MMLEWLASQICLKDILNSRRNKMKLDEIMHVVDLVSDIIKSRSLGDVVVRERLENYDI